MYIYYQLLPVFFYRNVVYMCMYISVCLIFTVTDIINNNTLTVVMSEISDQYFCGMCVTPHIIGNVDNRLLM